MNHELQSEMFAVRALRFTEMFLRPFKQKYNTGGRWIEG